jgi:hypothetical protein
VVDRRGRAADAGSANAPLMLGSTFDPRFSFNGLVQSVSNPTSRAPGSGTKKLQNSILTQHHSDQAQCCFNEAFSLPSVNRPPRHCRKKIGALPVSSEILRAPSQGVITLPGHPEKIRSKISTV